MDCLDDVDDDEELTALDDEELNALFCASLQKSVLHRHAKIDPDPSSVMSRCEHSGYGTRGSRIVPSNTRVGKHSLSVAVSVADFFQEYIRQASSLRHVCTWVLSDLEN